MVQRGSGLVLLLAASAGCGGTSDPSAGGPVLAADYGFCTPTTERAGIPLVWCVALGGTCTSPAACTFIDGGPAVSPEGSRPSPPPGQSLTVFLRENCRGVVSSAWVFVDRLPRAQVTPGLPGANIGVRVGEHRIEAVSPEGLRWKTFTRVVTARGVIQPLTCR